MPSPRVAAAAPNPAQQTAEVAPAQPGVFPEAATWVTEVLVSANKGDSLKNQLTWK